ncbi:MAG: DUF2779 domain-containing protein [Bdellovibrionales bacterium]|nr:DUF2779 domain-containing protein [Bdellovibrionales bacterium]
MKMLHYAVHRSELARERTEFEQAILDQGTVVGTYATKRYPHGVEIQAQPRQYELAAKLTQEAIERGEETIFEASFLHQGAYARVDILNKSDSGWDVIEVKSSSHVKPEHKDDLAFQIWILNQLNIPVSGSYLMHINNQCTYPDLTNLFTIVDLAPDVAERLPQIEASKHELLSVINSPDAPEVDIGPHCTKPYDCLYKAHCWADKNIPVPSVFDLNKVGKRGWDLYRRGVVDVHDITEDDLTERLHIPLQVYRTGERWVDQQKLNEHFSSWQYPLYFLDFESINPAIPRFEGTRSYQHIPFQYSLHTLETPDAELTHTDFLHTDPSDPRPALVDKLVNDIGPSGSIVVYHASFERGIISDLAAAFPDSSAQLNAMNTRLVDLEKVIIDAVYDPKFLGSYSIKKVAPALLGEAASYEGMAIGDGTAAMRGYEEVVGCATSHERRTNLVEYLKDYCRKDTILMVLLLAKLKVVPR